jgi:three-Cys-motif partner protein
MGPGAYVDPNPDYWDDYTNLQHTKHTLVREYLNGWFPKLGFWAGRIVYIDTHAGRGRHETGDLGSPLVALTTFLSHSSRDSILDHSDIQFIFIERDEENAAALQDELAALEEQLRALGKRRSKVAFEVYPGDCEQVLEKALDYLRSRRQRTAPSFIFVDPYGFKVSCALLRDLMTFERVELFVNVMWRHFYMGMCRAQTQKGWDETVAWILDDTDWQHQIACEDFDECASRTLDFIQRKLGAKWQTPVRMLGANNATEYLLVHFTNHGEGRDLMKEVGWKVCPAYDGSFVARKSDSPDQMGLGFPPEPDRRRVTDWVVSNLRDHPMRWKELLDRARSTNWLDKHVNAVVRDLRKSGMIQPRDFAPPFQPARNPLLSLSDEDID